MDTHDSTQTLISKARRGDRSAFDELAERLRGRLLGFIRTRLGHRLRRQFEPEDILQGTFLKAFGSLERFECRGKGSLFGWLATIAEYEIRGLGRSQKLDALPLDEDPSGSAPSPSRIVRREERFDRLESALDSLGADHRTVIRLARIEGLQIAEVARRMDRSPGAVRHLLLRALQKMRQEFGGETHSFGLPGRVLGGEEPAGDVD